MRSRKFYKRASIILWGIAALFLTVALLDPTFSIFAGVAIFLGYMAYKHSKKADYGFDKETGMQNPDERPRLKRKKVAERSKFDGNSIEAVERHYENVERIDIMYWDALDSGGLQSPEMEEVIALCLDDIELAPDFCNYWHGGRSSNKALPKYETFSILADIYEKRGEYSKAIEICGQAMQYGLIKDDARGGIPGRLLRLRKKQKNSRLQ